MGLRDLHACNIAHRDVKLDNVMLQFDEFDVNVDPVAKLIDLGCLCQFDAHSLNMTVAGTPAYLAPEIWEEQGYEGDKADIFAAAVTIFILVKGYYPFG